jgi:hypothetical protein
MGKSKRKAKGKRSMATASKVVFFSASPYGTGDIKTGSPTLTISSGVATLTVAQTGNIGAGCEIDFGASNTKVYIAPCRIGFDSGSTEPKIHDKIRGVTSGATGIVRAVELTSGSWAGGDGAGYIYFRKVTGTFQDDENINRVRPTASSNIATINGTIQGNMSTTFVVKDPDGTETANEGSAQTVNSIHHEYASIEAAEGGYTDANHINTINLITASIRVHICGYYDHDDQTIDSTNISYVTNTADTDRCVYFYTPQGNEESINDQRHDGKWNVNKYVVETTSNDVVVISRYCIFEGFQIFQNGDSGSDGIRTTPNASHTIYITHNIVKAALSGGDSGCYGISIIENTYPSYIYNNIIYDWVNAGKTNWGIYSDGPNYIYNNTVFNCYTGIETADNETHVKNNVVNDCGDTCYTGTFNTASTHNIGNGAASELAFGATYKTGQADDTAASKLKDADANFITNGVKVGCVVKNTTDTTYTRVTALDSEGQLSLNDDIFVNGENYEIYTNKIGDVTFNNEGADDFHLGADSFAKNLGTNLSADANLAFWDDIDNDERL